MSYKELKSFQQAAIVYDFTVAFCRRYIDGSDKTDKSDKSYRSYKSDKSYRTYKSYQTDRMSGQMVQAARSGKQNIAEGSAQSKNKPKSEHYLLAIASASLKELLEDYEDFLRQRGLTQWSKDDPRSVVLRQLAYKSDKSDRTDKSDKSYKSDKSDKSDRTDKSYTTYKSYLTDAEQAGNAMICLINQTTYLLDQQIKAVEKQMNEKGIERETQSQKILQVRNKEKKNEQAFWDSLKQAGSIKLANGQFLDVKELSEQELEALDLDEEWLSRAEVRQLWQKFHKKK